MKDKKEFDLATFAAKVVLAALLCFAVGNYIHNTWVSFTRTPPISWHDDGDGGNLNSYSRRR